MQVREWEREKMDEVWKRENKSSAKKKKKKIEGVKELFQVS